MRVAGMIPEREADLSALAIIAAEGVRVERAIFLGGALQQAVSPGIVKASTETQTPARGIDEAPRRKCNLSPYCDSPSFFCKRYHKSDYPHGIESMSRRHANKIDRYDSRAYSFYENACNHVHSGPHDSRTASRRGRSHAIHFSIAAAVTAALGGILFGFDIAIITGAGPF